jgi:4-diphosphocytidyl-2C-methyl-D-erythritol kinase
MALPAELLQTPLMLLKPRLAVPTAAIFGSSALKRDTKPAKISDFLAAPKRFGRNDLQDIAAAYQPTHESRNDIGLALEVMQNRFGNSRMTGSGSTVFSWIHPIKPATLPPSNQAIWDWMTHCGSVAYVAVCLSTPCSRCSIRSLIEGIKSMM